MRSLKNSYYANSEMLGTLPHRSPLEAVNRKGPAAVSAVARKDHCAAMLAVRGDRVVDSNQFTARTRPSQKDFRNAVFWISPAPEIGSESRNSTLRGHL